MEEELKNTPPLIKSLLDYPKEKEKFILFILRHKAIEYGLEMTKGGYVKISDLIQLSLQTNFFFDEQTIRNIVSLDRKSRYELTDNPPLMIRAVQGHSIRSVLDDYLLEKIDNVFNYPLIIHGTYFKPWSFIKQTGINRMCRNNIHFSIGYLNDSYVLSGMCSNSEIFIELNVIMSYYNDIPFYISKNNVILSPGINGVIPSCYIKKATDSNGNILLSQQYDITIQYNMKTNDIQIYSRLQRRESIDQNNNIKMSLDSVDEINAFSNHFIQTKFTKLPFIIIIEKKYEAEYNEKISLLIQKGLIEHPSMFIDYVPVDSLVNQR